jgi:glycosyltransferase involved in cell wall biosynthesis
MVRVAILWDSFPSYASKCIETLAKQEDVQVLAYCRSEGAFPNALERFGNYPNIHLLGNSAPEKVVGELNGFKPQLAVITITRRGLYADIASAWQKSGVLVVGACDHLWEGAWRNYANLFASKLGWFSQYEAVFVCGALGRIYAKKLGFPDQAIFEGLYTCDTDMFRPVGLSRHLEAPQDEWPRVFLFVGQYIRRKGLDILLKAYQTYRQQASHPWELWLIGSGEMENDIGEAPGVRNLGMKSPSQVAEIMRQAGCFVLPSRVDNWGVVIHEAANAGLPILASSMCGASVELVQSGFNGYVFPINDEIILARLLFFMDESGLAQEMGKNSLQLSSRLSPSLWARRVLYDIPLFLRGAPLVN